MQCNKLLFAGSMMLLHSSSLSPTAPAHDLPSPAAAATAAVALGAVGQHLPASLRSLGVVCTLPDVIDDSSALPALNFLELNCLGTTVDFAKLVALFD